ncbi:AlwI family type II restriction endonuclease [Longicatena caecimuris]|uniref:AlwI family type II restriction endonuclease n=1 Tax=Longicatena caecimuris TaxID=1796635 RepID=UPI0018AA7C7C|nr:AlwI family type II restriction endonuclease [Longicatena caecimuris]
MDLDINRIHFTSYCWSLGTTSFRMKKFNYMIEKQLELLDDFFMLSENKDEMWEGNTNLQIRYYNYLKEKEFVKGNAFRKDKDARQKTSGLVDLGLITSNRRLTDVGRKLVEISKSGVYKVKNDNFFGIDRDSYIYMLQLLKYTTSDNIKPFIVLIKILNELDYITDEEFKFILPLITNKEVASEVVKKIRTLRSGLISVDDIIIDLIWKMDNYQAGFEYFLRHEASEETFVLINMNRKSPERYEVQYAELYKRLVEVYVDGKNDSILALYEAVQNISGNPRIYWKNLLFGRATERQITKNPSYYLRGNKLSSLKDEYAIKKYVYEMIHLYKWKSTLRDYFDLNRRYFKLSDIIIFQDGKVSLSLLAKEYFKYCIKGFFEYSFSQSDNFDKVIPIEEILGAYSPDMDYVYEDVAAYFDEEYIDPTEIQNYVENERLEKFNRLIDEKFDNDNLLKLLQWFENRLDSSLSSYITDNADVPTMFEYVLGIIWYKLSDRKGNVLDYMNLSLDADLLPKTHAGGGEADIVYKYEETNVYPTHELLLEATLADDSNQRRMEFEPVSRHLMRNLMNTNNLNNYAVLVSTKIHPSVISDFRSRAKSEQTLDDIIYFEGIKILPIDTQVLKNFIVNTKKYKDIYQLLNEAYLSNITQRDGWYRKEIIQKSEI